MKPPKLSTATVVGECERMIHLLGTRTDAELIGLANVITGEPRLALTLQEAIAVLLNNRERALAIAYPQDED